MKIYLVIKVNEIILIYLKFYYKIIRKKNENIFHFWFYQFHLLKLECKYM